MSEAKAPPMTPEEYKEKKEKMMEYYKGEMDFLEVSKAYESLRTDIEELRMRQVYAQVKIANLIAPPPEEDKSEPKMKFEEAVASERKLKNDYYESKKDGE